MLPMNKTIKFRNLIKKNRNLLISKGFLPSTLTMWTQGKRNPMKPMARKLAKTLDIPLTEIPYIERFVINK